MKPYENDEPQQIPFEDKAIECPICEHDRFWIGGGQMHWPAGPAADCYVCAHCGHVLWFRPRGTY